MDEVRKIVLVPRVPKDPHLDLLFRTARGFAVQATGAQVEAVRSQGIAVVELYATADDYVAAMQNLTKEQAIAAVEIKQTEALAALDPADRGQFPVA
jgi:predicted Zn-dependent protease